MLRCTVNACHAQLKRRKRELLPGEMEACMGSVKDETPLWEYIGELPEKFRLPLLMHYGEDMRIEEVARALGLSRGTVSSRLSRGLELLRRDIKEEQEDET